MTTPYTPCPAKALCLVAHCRATDPKRRIGLEFIEVNEASVRVLDRLPPETFAFRFVEFPRLDFQVFGAAIDPFKAFRRSDLYYVRVGSVPTKKVFEGRYGPLTQFLQREEDPGPLAKLTDDFLLPVPEGDHFFNEANFTRNPHFELRPCVGSRPAAVMA